MGMLYLVKDWFKIRSRLPISRSLRSIEGTCVKAIVQYIRRFDKFYNFWMLVGTIFAGYYCGQLSMKNGWIRRWWPWPSTYLDLLRQHGLQFRVSLFFNWSTFDVLSHYSFRPLYLLFFLGRIIWLKRN